MATPPGTPKPTGPRPVKSKDDGASPRRAGNPSASGNGHGETAPPIARTAKATPAIPPAPADESQSSIDAAARSALDSTLKKAAAGDQHAWRSLIEAYSARVFGLIRAQCGSADLAEEITQSAFCTVVAKISSYTEVGRFEQWLFRIAMNRLRDEMRRRKRQARPTEDETLHALADAGGGGGSGAAYGQRSGGGAGGGESELFGGAGADPEQLKALRIALADLPEADQQIIHLRHNAGLSFKEIADVLEQPLGTVLARQHRALKKLAEVLKPVMGHDASAPVARVKEGPNGPKSRDVGGDTRRNGGEAVGGGSGGLDAQPSGP